MLFIQQNEMGPKKGSEKIEVRTETPPEFELENTAEDIQQRREERKAREK